MSLEESRLKTLGEKLLDIKEEIEKVEGPKKSKIKRKLGGVSRKGKK